MKRGPAHRRRVVVMARAPVMGRVKSRLARDVGAAEATRFCRTGLARVLRDLGRDPRWETLAAVTPDTALGEPVWLAAVPGIAQGPGDLGRRMGRIMRALPPGPVVIVGTDIPGLRGDHVAQAFAALGRADAVIGPSHDGGYYLVGLKRVPRVPDAFRGVRWSGPHALADTLANLDGLRVVLLGPLGDVDTGADWERWRGYITMWNHR